MTAFTAPVGGVTVEMRISRHPSIPQGTMVPHLIVPGLMESPIGWDDLLHLDSSIRNLVTPSFEQVSDGGRLMAQLERVYSE